uniref:FYVE-type domain-containing protein n=1 Tax=Mesocestoides corti TaxID=53468 RepID=A0A5K3FVF9_MESCO
MEMELLSSEAEVDRRVVTSAQDLVHKGSLCDFCDYDQSEELRALRWQCSDCGRRTCSRCAFTIGMRDSHVRSVVTTLSLTTTPQLSFALSTIFKFATQLSRARESCLRGLELKQNSRKQILSCQSK